MGDGRDLDRLDNNLKSTIQSYNENLSKVSKFEKTIKKDLLILSHNIDELSDFEIIFQERLLIVNYLRSRGIRENRFLMIKTQHLENINNLLDSSSIESKLRRLEIALQGLTTNCEVNNRILDSYMTLKDNNLFFMKR